MKLIAFYNNEAAETFGYCRAKSVDGKYVKATFITDEEDANLALKGKGDLMKYLKIYAYASEIGEIEFGSQHDFNQGATNPLPFDEFIHHRNFYTHEQVEAKSIHQLKIGDICPVCHKEYTTRQLATSQYIGCWC